MAPQPQTNQTNAEIPLMVLQLPEPRWPLAITFERKNQMPTADCLAFGTDKVTIAKPTVRHKPYHNTSKHSPRPRGRGAAIFARWRFDYFMLAPATDTCFASI
jgi:hypothetical protein